MRLFFISLTLLFSVTAFAQKKMPSGAVKTLEGKEIELNTLVGKGKIVVLSFWATWCAPCKLELDAYNSVYEAWKKKYPIEIVAVSIDQPRVLPKVAPMVSEKGWKFPVYTDENSVLPGRFGFQAIPQTYIIDLKGNIYSSHSGFTTNGEKIIEKEIANAIKG
jgi:cytochrome c biogenesis protein CcmG, thiol:disulfide interchange protein DsbE